MWADSDRFGFDVDEIWAASDSTWPVFGQVRAMFDPGRGRIIGSEMSRAPCPLTELLLRPAYHGPGCGRDADQVSVMPPESGVKDQRAKRPKKERGGRQKHERREKGQRGLEISRVNGSVAPSEPPQGLDLEGRRGHRRQLPWRSPSSRPAAAWRNSAEPALTFPSARTGSQ